MAARSSEATSVARTALDMTLVEVSPHAFFSDPLPALPSGLEVTEVSIGWIWTSTVGNATANGNGSPNTVTVDTNFYRDIASMDEDAVSDYLKSHPFLPDPLPTPSPLQLGGSVLTVLDGSATASGVDYARGDYLGNLFTYMEITNTSDEDYDLRFSGGYRLLGQSTAVGPSAYASYVSTVLFMATDSSGSYRGRTYSLASHSGYGERTEQGTINLSFTSRRSTTMSVVGWDIVGGTAIVPEAEARALYFGASVALLVVGQRLRAGRSGEKCAQG